MPGIYIRIILTPNYARILSISTISQAGSSTILPQDGKFQREVIELFAGDDARIETRSLKLENRVSSLD